MNAKAYLHVKINFKDDIRHHEMHHKLCLKQI